MFLGIDLIAIKHHRSITILLSCIWKNGKLRFDMVIALEVHEAWELKA